LAARSISNEGDASPQRRARGRGNLAGAGGASAVAGVTRNRLDDPVPHRSAGRLAGQLLHQSPALLVGSRRTPFPGYAPQLHRGAGRFLLGAGGGGRNRPGVGKSPPGPSIPIRQPHPDFSGAAAPHPMAQPWPAQRIGGYFRVPEIRPRTAGLGLAAVLDGSVGAGGSLGPDLAGRQMAVADLHSRPAGIFAGARVQVV